MSGLLQDLRYTLRRLRNGPGFAAMAIATIALAIGANTAMFSFVNGVLISPLPYPNPERVVRVLERRPDGGPNGISTLNFLDWKRDSTVFEYLAAQTGWGATLTGRDEPVQLRGVRVSPALLDINGAKLLLGRKFLPDEDQVGKDRVVLLSYAALAEPLRGGSLDRRPQHRARRRALRGHRRARQRRHVRSQPEPDHQAPRVRACEHDAQFPLDGRGRQAQGRCHARAGSRRDGRHRQAHRGAVSGLEQGLGRGRRPARRTDRGPAGSHGRRRAVLGDRPSCC